MNSVPFRSGSAWSLTFTAIRLCVASASHADAQAWVPQGGQGDISISYQRISNTGHRLTNGFLVEGGQSVNMAGYIEADYAVTDRLSFTAGVPYVFSKYTDPNPPPPPIPYLPQDQCHCWHSGWQDFGLTARYNVIHAAGGTFALTPSVSAGVPSHDYQFRGESALGRDLKEVSLGLDAGQRLDAISSNLSVIGHYSYAFVEPVLDIPDNRSNASVEGRYMLLRGKLAVRGFGLWQRTHGGLRFGSPPPATLEVPGEVDTPERLFEHDRLLRDNYFRAGAGFSYAFPSIDVFGSYIYYVSGTDTHAGAALTLGISWPFDLHSIHRR
jgi:hypothetical protein